MPSLFKILPNTLPHNDLRYKRWRESLKKRPAPWSKGFTKHNHPSVLKISKTFKKKKIDNFKWWRERMKASGKIKTAYPPFKQNGDLAELIGMVLGDGHIEKFLRTESLTIVCSSAKRGIIKRYSSLIKKIFNKKPGIGRIGSKNYIRIRIYQKYISKRLNIPTGNKNKINIKAPSWIFKNKDFLIRYLRGLYEAEGAFCIHKPTHTHKLFFSNKNKSLLDSVYNALKILGFHPHKSKYKIQLSRKEEVYKVKKLLRFRQY